MTTLQIVSDLHIEYKNNEVPDPLDYITPSADILVLAGDIGSLYKIDQIDEFLKRLCPHFNTVLYVMGNHEFYMIDKLRPLSTRTLLNRLGKIENGIPNLHILDKKSVRVGDICIAGCTLWSKPEVILPKFIVKINNISTEMYNYLHNKDREYIEKMIDYCSEKKLKLVVVTHYPPTYKALKGTKKENQRYSSYYATDLERLLKRDKVDTWICGHVHKNFDFFTGGGTRVISNQLGKPKDDVQDYYMNCVIEVE